VEDGGTGVPPLMVSDGTLATHTIFRPKDLSPFGEKVKLPIVAWAMRVRQFALEHVNFLSEVRRTAFW